MIKLQEICMLKSEMMMLQSSLGNEAAKNWVQGSDQWIMMLVGKSINKVMAV